MSAEEESQSLDKLGIGLSAKLLVDSRHDSTPAELELEHCMMTNTTDNNSQDHAGFQIHAPSNIHDGKHLESSAIHSGGSERAQIGLSGVLVGNDSQRGQIFVDKSESFPDRLVTALFEKERAEAKSCVHEEKTGITAPGGNISSFASETASGQTTCTSRSGHHCAEELEHCTSLDDRSQPYDTLPPEKAAEKLRKKKQVSTALRRPAGSETLDESSSHRIQHPTQALTLLSSPRGSRHIVMSRPTSLLVASIGNPPPYHGTRHSAAHIVLRALQPSLSLPPFASKSKSYGGGHVSIGGDVGRPDFTLYQSAVQMNISGPPLLKAWKHFTQTQEARDRNVGLVVLHDEMETMPGQFKVRRGNSSARGHNGLKSIQSSFQGAGLLSALGDRFVRIAVGIGRPSSGSRESKDVSAYVLGQLTRQEKDALEAGASVCERLLRQEIARIGQGS